jgi:hypothetical protein
MSSPATPSRPARPRTRTADSRGPRQLTLPTARTRRDRRRTALPRMSELAIDTAVGGRVIDLRRDRDAATCLPRGRANGRYLCCACAAQLVFTGPATPTSSFTPRFRHDTHHGADQCTAPAPHRADVQADLTAVLALRDQLARAVPDAVVHLVADPTRAGQRWELPPALVLVRGEDLAVIEHPRRPLTPEAAIRRLGEVRARHGAKASHWWVFDHGDPAHHVPAGTVEVRVDGAPRTHQKVEPTPAQRALATAGAVVCWTTGEELLFPYGAHPLVYQPRAGEDWSGEMASWARDWRISRPRPVDGAAWWGLVPVPPLRLAAYAGFRTTAAANVMAALARSEHGRETHRRKLAREHAQRLAATQPTMTPPAAQPAPAEPSPAPAPQEPKATAAGAPSVPSIAPVPPLPAAPPPHVTPTRRRLGWRRLLPRRWRR